MSTSNCTPVMARALGEQMRRVLDFARAIEHLSGFASGEIRFHTGDAVVIGSDGLTVQTPLSDRPLSLDELEQRVEHLEAGICP